MTDKSAHFLIPSVNPSHDCCQYKRSNNRCNQADYKKIPCRRSYDPEGDYEDKYRQVEKMRESRQEPCPLALELWREMADPDGLSRDTAKAHEIEARYSVALDELEGEKKYHPGKPGDAGETPAAVN